MSRQLNPASAQYRKTSRAVRDSTAYADDLVTAAVNVLDLIAHLADAGVFGLALDLPAGVDVDADVTALDAALQKRVAAGTPLTADQRAARDALSGKLSDVAARVNRTSSPSTSLVGAAARLLFLMGPRVSPYAKHDLGTQVLRRLDGLADALAAEVDAEDDAAAATPEGSS
jgi:hypothetical protein